MDEIEKVRAELKALEEELVQTDKKIVQLKQELEAAEKRRNEIQSGYFRERGAIPALRHRLARLEQDAERAKIWATSPVVKIEGRPDGRLIKLTQKQVHVMISADGQKTIYDRATGRTRWDFEGRITNLEELTK